jgi:hypothetical protein
MEGESQSTRRKPECKEKARVLEENLNVRRKPEY